MTIEEQAFLYRHGIYEKRFAKQFAKILKGQIFQLADEFELMGQASNVDTKPLQAMYQRLYNEIMTKEGKFIWNSLVMPITGIRVKDVFDSLARDLPPENVAEMPSFWNRLMGGFLTSYISQRIVEVTKTTIKRFNESVERFRNDGMTNAEIARMIKADARARELRGNTIARTEATTAMNKSWILALQSSKLQWEKAWNAIRDDRTRDSHFMTSPENFISIEDNFIIGGFQMAYPGDSTQGSPVGELINCRCFLKFRFAGSSYGFRPKR
jgi:hypothetical protein